jgi:hypothetical protein
VRCSDFIELVAITGYFMSFLFGCTTGNASAVSYLPRYLSLRHSLLSTAQG